MATRPKRLKITAEFIRAHEDCACNLIEYSKVLRWFKRSFPDGLHVTRGNALLVAKRPRCRTHDNGCMGLFHFVVKAVFGGDEAGRYFQMDRDVLVEYLGLSSRRGTVNFHYTVRPEDRAEHERKCALVFWEAWKLLSKEAT